VLSSFSPAVARLLLRQEANVNSTFNAISRIKDDAWMDHANATTVWYPSSYSSFPFVMGIFFLLDIVNY
jgi:hypothetical protein